MDIGFCKTYSYFIDELYCSLYDEVTMPYIKQNKRNLLDGIVSLMKDLEIEADGDLNYILFKYCKYHVIPSYNNYKNFIGELRQCAAEIERRLLVPYEDSKCKINRDV